MKSNIWIDNKKKEIYKSIPSLSITHTHSRDTQFITSLGFSLSPLSVPPSPSYITYTAHRYVTSSGNQ